MKVIFKQNVNAVDTVLNNQDAILFHVCNNEGVMESGIAEEIKERIPTAYENYVNQSLQYNNNMPLGIVSFSTEFNVCNLVVQIHKSKSDKRLINYGALGLALQQSMTIIKATNPTIKTAVIPFNIGCDTAGGEWETVIEIIEYYFKPYFDELLICSYKGKNNV